MDIVEEVEMIGMQKGRARRPRPDRGELGASLVEYALMVALIAVVCIGAMTYFGGSNETGMNRSKDCLVAAHNAVAAPSNCP